MIQNKVSRPPFESWFVQTSCKITYGKLYILTQNAFARDWLEERYASLILECLSEVTQEKYELVFVVKDQDSVSSTSFTLESTTQLPKQKAFNDDIRQLLMEQKKTNQLLEEILTILKT
ncbi:DnaA N-terminal domain-containing protein [Peribacillus loiseleuriae]|uniref:DnaA N-terminal domain-containing protein n=1 Tax=Peribacillus loiseleuriae TaxID=1679170 RepID=UPI00381BC6BC